MDDMLKMAKVAAEVGARSAIEKLKAEQERARTERRDKRLRNTKLLLQNYRCFKDCIENSIFDINQLEKENALEILDLMWEGSGSLQVDSIKESVTRTAVIVEHVNAMLNIYSIYCERSKRVEDKRRYRIVRDLYFSEVPDTIEGLAKREGVDKRTIYKDIDAAIEKISALLFGVDSLQ